MTFEVPSSYTKVGSQITTDSTRWTYGTVTRETDQYTYYDFGASYFSGSAYFESTIYASATAGTGNKTLNTAFTNYVNDWSGYSGGEAGGEIFGSSANANILYALVNNGTQPFFSSALTFSTPYYVRTGFFSALGRYGAIVIQIYSDLSRTALVDTEISLRIANDTYRYLMVGQNYTIASNTNSITGYEENLTIFQPAAGIDLTTATGGFTQTDPSAHIADYADCLVCTTLNTNEDAYHYKDYGASYFNGNYILTGVLNVTAFASGSGTMLTLLSLMNTINDGNNTDDKHCVILDYVSASTYTIKAREVPSATGYNSSASSTLNTNQPYWIKSWRDTSVGTYGTLYLAIYNDPTMLSQVGSTLSLALHDNGTPDVAAFQYFYPLQSWNNSSSRTTTFTFGGVTQQNQVYNATKGAFSWAGTTATISEQPTSINLGLGSFGWAGKASPLSLMIQATKGPFSWAGKTVNLNTGGQVNTTVGAFSWGGKSSPLSYIRTATVGAFSWVGKTVLVGSTVTSLRTATLTKWDTVTEKEIPDTGLTSVLYMLYDPINLLVYDFSDNTFKASASCVTPQGTMTERVLLNSVGTNLTPGIYDILLATTGLSGLYQEYLFYYGTTNHLDSNPVRFQDGIEYLGGLTVAENTTLNVIPSAVLTAAQTTPIHADIQKVRSQSLTGDGSDNNPWNPV